MDVKFKKGLCNLQPIKIDGYGKYKFENPFTLMKGIPKLPDELFEMICNPEPKATVEIKPAEPYDNNLVKQFCEFISEKRMYNYHAWIQVGMTLKNIGAPLSQWEDRSNKSRHISILNV